MSRYLLDRELRVMLKERTGKVLNLGCGRVPYHNDMMPDAQVETADFNENYATTHTFDATKEFPLEPESFDLVISFNVMEHLDNYRVYLSEIRRILKKDGEAIISVPFMYPFHGQGYGDYWRFTHLGIRQVASEAGFSSVEVQRLGGRFSIALDLITNTFPSFVGSWLRMPFAGIVDYLDNHIFTNTEKRDGKAYCNILLVRMRK